MTSKQQTDTIEWYRINLGPREYGIALKKFIGHELRGNRNDTILMTYETASEIAIQGYPEAFLNFLKEHGGLQDDINRPF